MSCLIAVGVFMVAFLIGLASFLMLPHIKSKYEDDSTSDKKTSVAKMLKDFFRKNNWKNIVTLSVTALLCAVTEFLLSNKGLLWLDIFDYMVMAIALLSVLIIDKNLHIIPNKIVFAVLLLGCISLVLEFIFLRDEFVATLISKLIGLFVCVVLFYVLGRLTKNGIGMGDIKLIATIGWLLGFSATMFSILFSLIISASYAVVLLVLKKKTKNDRLAFGPFMFFGYILLLMLIGI